MGYDVSGLDRFWETAEVLAADRDPGAEGWSRLLDHPGYAVVEAKGGHRDAIRRCMALVFRPSRRDSLAEALEDGGSRVRTVCAHLEAVRDRRDELERFAQALSGSDDPGSAVERAARYLPEGATDGPVPSVYVVLFEKNGFGGESVAVDGALLGDMSDEMRLEFLGHEFHHAYRDRVSRAVPYSDDDRLVHALSRLAKEGIASLIDKRRWLGLDFGSDEGAFWAGLAAQFRELHAGSPEVLAEVDAHLAAVERGESSPDEAARRIAQALPWGGHPTGMYMALGIERTSGPRYVAELSTDPLGFVLAYQRVAEESTDLHPFSDEAVRVIERLRRGDPR